MKPFILPVLRGLLEVAGVALFTAAALIVWEPLGMIVLGAFAIAASQALKTTPDE